MYRSGILILAVVLSLFSGLNAHAASPDPIDPQPLSQALDTWARQNGLQVIYGTELTKDRKSKGARAGVSAKEALTQILAGTGLQVTWLNERTASIHPGKALMDKAAVSRTGAVRLTEVSGAAQEGRVEAVAQTRSQEAVPENSKGIPEILVKGARTSNTDIRRTEDDVQPYVVFDAEEIERSMAPDLETFLKTRLPMNQSRASNSQEVMMVLGNQSTIDLRGLGADQTLILVNGRRMPGVPNLSDFAQPDINGIPVSAVERIEILPSTAGGIYGGGATGGVVNIILKRNYSDLELSARYDGTFAGGGAERRLDATGGFTLEGGRTSVMLMASYRDGNPLYIGDRDFTARARRLQDGNNRGALIAQSNPLHGYTTNVRSVSGRDLELLEGGSLNASIAYVPVGYAGPAGDNGAAFLGTAGHYNLNLANDLVGNQYSLLLAPTVSSLALNLQREFPGGVEAFVDVSRHDNRSLRIGSEQTWTDINVTLPVGANNPFTEAVRLSVPVPGYDASRLRTRADLLTEQVSGGLIVRLPREWTVQGEYSWSRSNSTYDFPRNLLTSDGAAALIDGRLSPLSDVNAYPMDFSAYVPDDSGRNPFAAEFPSVQKDATLRLAGPLLNLSGGPLRLAALLEKRQQYTGDRLITTFDQTTTTPTYAYIPEVGSATESVYAELTAPLVSAANARRGLLDLDLQASYRHDATRTGTQPANSSITVPSADGPFPEVPMQINKVTGHQYTLGVRYTPMENLALRVSYGEGILPPAPFQLSEFDFQSSFLAFSGFRDPKRDDEAITGATVEKYSIIGSLALRPEHSQSWSAGAILTPASLPGLRLSLDYTRIEKVDEIGSLNTQVLIDLEDSFPGAIVRNPLTPADQALGYTGGTIRELKAGNVNIAHSLMEAVDLQADYTWQTRLGAFAAHVIATVQPRLAVQPVPDAQELNTVGYSNGPLKWRANAGLRWSRGPLELGWNLQYYDASRVYSTFASTTSRNSAVLNQGSALIPTQTYHDAYGRYRFDNAPGFARGLLENTELQVSVQNVLNTSPPILASAGALVRGYATEGDARLRRYSIAFTKRFGR